MSDVVLWGIKRHINSFTDFYQYNVCISSFFRLYGVVFTIYYNMIFFFIITT